MKRSITATVAALALAAGLAGCAGSSAPAGGAGTSSDAAATTLTVFAAASLKSSFTELADTFEAQHPGTRVSVSFAGSSDLATQINQGAPADVFASADTKNMDKVTGAGLAGGEPRVFATNTLAIAVPAGNPAHVTGFQDLARDGLRLVTCAKQVPCGAAAATVAGKAGVTLRPVSEENAVTDVLGKVTSGEADAGLVYVTDVKSAGDKVDSIPFPEAAAAVNSYPITSLSGAKDKEAAKAFIDLVLGPGGQQVLAKAGFGSGGQ
ncbi:molybdate ABC transporter substrate-binding protein [Pseudarthrobacter equi]|uniref:molybdate ABC transporter substrate-binding protein n=1 Tax=Pseudarthrobacter equi TaxID=728066 RepID=UPI0028D5DC3E|nr:molybdate ABC transporter substrate-binding protein [Pseudarthrobacter equi]